MTKWFDTNYHYIVPEIGAGDGVRARRAPSRWPRCGRPRELGFETRPVLVGPVTFLLLSRRPRRPPGSSAGPAGRRAGAYEELLARAGRRGRGLGAARRAALVPTARPTSWPPCGPPTSGSAPLPTRPALFVASYFGDLGEALPVLAAHAGRGDRGRPGARRPGRGSADAGGQDARGGRGVRPRRLADRPGAGAGHAARRARAAAGTGGSTSCSLLHVPYDVAAEPDLDPG